MKKSLPISQKNLRSLLSQCLPNPENPAVRVILEAGNKEYAMLRSREETDPKKAISLMLLALILEPRGWTKEQKSTINKEIKAREKELAAVRAQVSNNFTKNLDSVAERESERCLVERIDGLKEQLKRGPA